MQNTRRWKAWLATLVAATAKQASWAELHAAGIELSLDDFGTGYSALSYLHQFELNYLKIDQSFVRDLRTGSKNLALCKATIVMAHELLGLKVVDEGIETEEQRHLLTQAGCDDGHRVTCSLARCRSPILKPCCIDKPLRHQRLPAEKPAPSNDR